MREVCWQRYMLMGDAMGHPRVSAFRLRDINWRPLLLFPTGHHYQSLPQQTFCFHKLSLDSFLPWNRCTNKYLALSCWFQLFLDIFIFVKGGDPFLRGASKCNMTDTEPNCHSQPKPAAFFLLPFLYNSIFGRFLPKYKCFELLFRVNIYVSLPSPNNFANLPFLWAFLFH